MPQGIYPSEKRTIYGSVEYYFASPRKEIGLDDFFCFLCCLYYRSLMVTSQGYKWNIRSKESVYLHVLRGNVVISSQGGLYRWSRHEGAVLKFTL